jgi:hypothetical protein
MSADRRLTPEEARSIVLRALRSLKRRVQAPFERGTTTVTTDGQWPDEYPRPPARLKAAVSRADEPALGFKPKSEVAAVRQFTARIVARYVSVDFGAFLEVARARPQFEGHAQPRLPSVSGLYFRPDSLRQQADLARQYGIDAFAFDFDIEHGPEQPAVHFHELADAQLLYCLAVKTQDLEPAGSLAAQLQPHFSDSRYLRVDGRAVLLIKLLGDASPVAGQIRQFRDAAARQGLGELLLVARLDDHSLDAAALGVDATLPQAPGSALLAPITALQTLINPAFRGEVLDWRQLAGQRSMAGGTFAVVNAGSDDEPARPGTGCAFAHSSPRGYGEWLCRSIVAAESREAPFNQLVFVDSWNDWRHGAVLEPDARLGYAYLEQTRSALTTASQQLAPARSAIDHRPCAVVHVYYVELFDEIAEALIASGCDWRVIVTTQADRAQAVRSRLDLYGLEAEIEIHENRGRDILPFLRVAYRLLDEGADVVLKLHTKHSPHRTNGAAWRAELIGRLVEPARAMRIVEAFGLDPELGCVAPEGHVLPLAPFWGANEESVRHLCVRMGVAGPDAEDGVFVAGSMFWVRLSSLRPLLDAHLGEWEFGSEGGHIDGTMAHAIERAILLGSQGAGFKMMTAAEACGVSFKHNPVYAFAPGNRPAAK